MWTVNHLLSLPSYHLILARISFNAQILRSLPLERPTECQHRSSRPRSPVKLLSSMIGGVANYANTPNRLLFRAPTTGDAPYLPAANGADAQCYDGEKTNTSLSKQPHPGSNHRDAVRTSLQYLEDTFAAYIIALRSRSGNVMGKCLQARASTDELQVNELYNAILEEPDKVEIVA